MEGIAEDALPRENLIQCDIGVAHLRRMVRTEAEEQARRMNELHAEQGGGVNPSPLERQHVTDTDAMLLTIFLKHDQSQNSTSSRALSTQADGGNVSRPKVWRSSVGTS